MQIRRLFAPKLFSQLQKHKTYFALGISASLILSSLFLMNTPVRARLHDHGCAPDTPPPVSGNPVTPPTQAGIIMINEVLANPTSLWNCSTTSGNVSFTSNSWIELYNPQNTPFDLYPTHTQISIDGGTNWYHFPPGTSIASYGFLVLFPEEHLQPAPSWNLILTMGSALVDAIQVPALGPDQSYARALDGSKTWVFSSQPTINASNDSSSPTATLTQTSTVNPISTPIRTPTSKGTGPANRTSTPANTGTQPAWNKLQLPPGTTPGTEIPAMSPASTLDQGVSIPQDNTRENWHIALLVSLFLLLGGAITWCWRLFRTP